MTERRLGIIVHGATGRLGSTQHLARALMPIRAEGGLPLANGDRLVPDPVLVGRNADKLATLARTHGGLPWTTDLDEALSDPGNELFFDCAATASRIDVAGRAIEAGKHVFLEKPVAPSLEDALALAKRATDAKLKNGVIQDKVFLPGLVKIKRLVDDGFFGRIVSVRLEFGWWIFDGEERPAQRPSWNYRRSEGGGLALDMYPHWRYVIDQIVAPVRRVCAICPTHVPERRDEAGERYDVDVEDGVYALMELEGGIVATVTSSWATRVRRDDLLGFQIDGTLGSAVAGLHDCCTQTLAETPIPFWNPDAPQELDLLSQWKDAPDESPYPSSFRSCWEGYLRHLTEDLPFRATLLEGAKGVQLAELAVRSSREKRWLEVEELGV